MTDKAKERKDTPVFSGVLAYFPDAIEEVARVSKVGNDQHNPGKELHWDRSKSGDEKDALTRHLIDAGTLDDDGLRHSAKVAWRALANLQKEIEREEQEAFEERIIAMSKEDNTMYPDPEMAIYGVKRGTWSPCAAHALHEDDPVPGSVDHDLAEIAREERMRIIGQNGNDGLHYDEANYMYDKISDYPESNITSTLYPGDIKVTYNEVQKEKGKENNQSK